MDFSKYENKLSYPSKYPKPSKSLYLFDATSKSLREYADALEVYELKNAHYQEEKAKYQAEGARLLELFKEDVLKEVRLHEHKNADKIFSYAWEKGHSEGFEAVYWILNDLSDLIN
jgi:hypothetical protein